MDISYLARLLKCSYLMIKPFPFVQFCIFVMSSRLQVPHGARYQRLDNSPLLDLQSDRLVFCIKTV